MKPTLSRRRFLQRIGLGATGAILAACGGSPPVTQTTNEQSANAQSTNEQVAAAPQGGKAKQIVRFTMFGHPNLAEQMVTKFNETHPDIEVQFERSEGQGYGEKISAALAGGDAWDCFRAPSTWPSRFGPKGVVEDLNPYIQSDSQYPASAYIEGALDVWNVDGKRYGLPTWALTMWLFYNKKLLDEAGVPYPTPDTTWDEYVQMAQKLTKQDSSGMITQYGANGWGSWTLPIAQDVWSAGGCFYYNKDKTAICMDDPTTVKTLQDEAALMNKYKVHPSPLNPPSSPVSLLSGKVATELNGDWMPWDNREQWSEDFDATLAPLRDGKRVNCYMADPMVINSASQVKEAAYQWISWFAADPDSWAIQGKVVFPLVKRQYEDPQLRATWLTEPRPPHMIELALEHAKNAQLWQVTKYSDEFESSIYSPEIDKLWRDKASAEEVCTTITKQGNELLAKPTE